MLSFLIGLVVTILVLVVLLIGLLAIRFFRGRKKELAVWASARVEKISDPGDTGNLTILPLVDWDTSGDDLKGEPGVSYLVRTDHGTILFDLGFNEKKEKTSPLIHNMEKLGVSLDTVDTIVISHNHPDHVGGMAAKRRRTFSFGDEQPDLSKKTIYTPIEMHYPGTSPVVADAPAKIADGVVLTGTIPRQLFFFGWTPEQAMVVNVAGKGLVIIVGCGHQTVTRILKRVSDLFDIPVYAIIGGLHFPVTDGHTRIAGIPVQKFVGTGKPPWKPITREEVEENIRIIQEVSPGLVALSAHDSCEKSLELFAGYFGEKFQRIRVGEPIRVGGA